MRALRFKIMVDSLILKDWDEWKREDQGYLESTAKRNDISMEYDPKYNELSLTGKHEDLFTFLYDMAYKYDIEIM